MKVKSSIISHSLNANTKHIGGLIGSSVSLLASEIASNTKKPLILVNSSATHASIITSEIKLCFSVFSFYIIIDIIFVLYIVACPSGITFVKVFIWPSSHPPRGVFNQKKKDSEPDLGF